MNEFCLPLSLNYIARETFVNHRAVILSFGRNVSVRIIGNLNKIEDVAAVTPFVTTMGSNLVNVQTSFVEVYANHEAICLLRNNLYPCIVSSISRSFCFAYQVGVDQLES